MENIHRDTLRRCRLKLVHELMVDDLWDLFLVKEIFTVSMLESIQCQNTRTNKIRKLLDDIIRRGPNVYHLFLKCLEETKQTHIAEFIREEEKILRNNPSMNYTMWGNFLCTPVTPTEIDTSTSVHYSSGVNLTEQSKTDISATTCEPMEVNTSISETTSLSQPRRSQSEQEVYKMSSGIHGLVLIINNEKFERNGPRSGSLQDAEKLKDLFWKLSFLVDVKTNLTGEMKIYLQTFAKYSDHAKYDCCIVAILTHGKDRGCVYGTDEAEVNLEEIYSYFSPRFAPDLEGKPKMFIVQACRGVNKDEGHAAEEELPRDTVANDLKFIVEDGVKVDQKCSITHSRADMVIAYATVPGQVAWRNSESGSWFIQAFVDIFENYADRESVTDMLILVNNKVANEFNKDKYRQIPAPELTLTKKWYLTPQIMD